MGGIFHPHEAQKVGKLLREEIEARFSKIESDLKKTNAKRVFASKKLNEWFNKELEMGNPIGSHLSPEIEKLIEAIEELDRKEKKLYVQYKAGRSEIITDVLSLIRPMGNKREQTFFQGVNKEIKPKLEAIEKYYPADWWDQTNKTKLTVTSRKKRAQYDADTKEMIIRKTVPEDVVAHEYAHRFEHELYQVGDLAKEYLLDRTANGTNPREQMRKLDPTSKKRYNKEEIVFINSGFAYNYMAKIYEKTKGKLDFRATEILSVGIQGLYFNTFDMWDKDIKSIDFVLGVLASR